MKKGNKLQMVKDIRLGMSQENWMLIIFTYIFENFLENTT